MTDSESWKERRTQLTRYRLMEQETTDPVAARLLLDIILDLEVELEGSPQSAGLDALAVMAKSRLSSAPDIPTVDEGGLTEFYGGNWTAF